MDWFFVKLSSGIVLFFLLTIGFVFYLDSGKQPEPGRTVQRLGKSVYTICVDEVEYLVYKSYKKGGITVKYNKDGTVKTCVGGETAWDE